MDADEKPTGREGRRLRTRQRVFDAAVAEFRDSGMADADIGRIVTEAGVARGTFYFHFATKEHVVLEILRLEEVRVSRSLTTTLARPHTLRDALEQVVAQILEVERRIGPFLFKDVLSLHFSPTRPLEDEWTEHPVIVTVIDEIGAARDRGEVYADADAFHSGLFFLLGLYALLATTSDSKAVRETIVDKFVATALRSLEPR